MAYPTTLDTLRTTFAAGDTRSGHAGEHARLGRIVNALQILCGTYAGTDSIIVQLAGKQDAVAGMGLSKNDYGDAEKAKLAFIEITQAVNLDTLEANVASLMSGGGSGGIGQLMIQFQNSGLNIGGIGAITTLNFQGGIRASVSGGDLVNVDLSAAAPGTPLTTSDSSKTPAGASVTADDTNKWIKIQYADGSKEEYYATGGTPYANKYLKYNNQGELVFTSNDVMTYAGGVNPKITITASGDTIDGITGVKSFLGAEIAYKNKQNQFDTENTFKGPTNFEGLVGFKYYDGYAHNTTAFNGSNGNKQKFTLSTPGAYTLSFSNLIKGCNLVIAIVVSGGTCTLNKATSFTDCDVISGQYSIGSTVFPLTLANGVHIMVCEAFTTGIHINHVPSVPS